MSKKSDTNTVLSFRGYIQAEMTDFVQHFKRSDLAADALAEFIVVLSSYQEEGVRLFPTVFIGEDLNDILSITKGMDPIFLGHEEQNRESVRRAFKRFAPLTEGREWAAFVIFQKSSMNYGVFRNDLSPLVPTAFERLRQTKNLHGHTLGLSRLGGGFVEIRSASGQFKYINLAGDYESTKNPPKLIRDFMGIVTRDAPSEIHLALQSFYYRVGIDLLHANHGSLLAVTRSDRPVPSIFRDGIILDQKIEISKAISEYLQRGGNESYERLIGWNQLLRRMTRMDGITLMDTSGAIVGYSCFIRDSKIEEKLKPNSSVGGARRRAFEALCSCLGDDLPAVIYKSHDGVIEMEVAK